ncbi:uracil-DNA glycosylase family protein [Caproiciproducens galactitolivorans]|uniref:uracil-DNA glycosylase family protein n=1 Tax=Caproiciproducens galactitolivorans TaxID=642589 RepID=UPI002ED09CC2
MPSPKSREAGFYYSHPQNRFWRVVSDLLSQELPVTNEEKTDFLLRNHIALWDVLKSCTITGADDNSIQNPVPNDIGDFLRKNGISTRIYNWRKSSFLVPSLLREKHRNSFYPPAFYKSGQLPVLQL